MATLYKVDGSIESISPKNGKAFSYKELAGFVGGMVQIVPLPSGKSIVVNEEGKLIGLLYNANASAQWCKEYPIKKYPDNNDQYIAGDALICSETEID